MLDTPILHTLTGEPFAARIGQDLMAEGGNGELALRIYTVKENPLAAGPGSRRTPFRVLLRGPDSPVLADGCFNLRTDGADGWRLEGVYLNRIIPCAGSDGTGAFYQIVFG